MEACLRLAGTLNVSLNDESIEFEDGGAANALTIQSEPIYARLQVHMVQKGR